MLARFRKLAIALSIVAVVATGGISHAVPIVGSLPLAGLNVTQNGANLAVSTLITAADSMVSGPGMGDYSPIAPIGTSFGAHTLDLSDLVALVANFSISNANFGSFTATSAQILTRSAEFLDIFFLGDFTPGPALLAANPALDPSSATSLRISINQSGQSLSEAITLNSPPFTPPGGQVPEPGTWVLLTTGILGLLSYGWRRRG